MIIRIILSVITLSFLLMNWGFAYGMGAIGNHDPWDLSLISLTVFLASIGAGALWVIWVVWPMQDKDYDQ